MKDCHTAQTKSQENQISHLPLNTDDMRGDEILSRAAVLNLQLETLWEVEGPFHKGHISDILHIRYLYYAS